MDKLKELSRGRQLMLAGGVLLLLDTFLHWQEVSLNVSGITVISAGRNAWHGFWGVVMCLALVALLAWVVARVAGVTFSLPVSEVLLAAVLALVVLLFAVIKNLDDDFSTKWSYIGIVLAAVVAVGAWLEVQAAGGVDSVRSRAPMSVNPAPAGAAAVSPPPVNPPPAESTAPPSGASEEPT